jgi:hypothetical protein
MVWLQVNIPLVVGCLLMAALMDLRLFKLCLLVASILLIFLAAGVIVFGTRQGIIPANAVAVLSVMVWLACVVSVIRRWVRSKRPYEPFGSKADRTGTCETALSGGAWMMDPTTGRLTSQIASEFRFDRLISDPFGSTLYGVVLGEAGWDGPVHLVRLDEGDGRVLQARTFEPGDWAPNKDPYRRRVNGAKTA